jgi:hypothetical protein
LSATTFINSVHAAVLLRLSLSLHFIPSVLRSDNITEYKTVVDLVPSVLQGLLSMSFGDSSAEVLEDGVEDIPLFKVKGKKGKSQKQKKRDQKAGRKNLVDSAAFDKLGEPVPISQSEADSLVATLLSEQKHILTVSSLMVCTLCY